MALALGCVGSMVAVSPAGAASSSSGVAKAQALVKQYSGDPAFTSPGPSFKATKAAGKTIFGLPASSSVPFVNTVDQSLAGYARDLGLSYDDYPNQQEQSQWVQGMNQAVSDKASIIDLIGGIPPEQLAPQVQAAKAAGIPTVDVAERDPSQPTQPYVAAYSFVPFAQAGKLMGAWAVSQTKGKANILVVTSNADISSAAEQNGITTEVKQTCPSCKITTINMNPTDWATKLQTSVEGALAGNPNINYILPVYDSMAEFISPAIIAAGKTGQVHIATFNGTPAILNTMRTGNTLTMDVGENEAAAAAGGLDQSLRVLLGMKPGNEVLGLRIFTKQNVSQAGVPAQAGKGYGNAYLQGYAKTWGVPVSRLK